MSYGGFPYGGVAYAGSDVAEIPQADTRTALAVEVAFTTDALAEPMWADITSDVRSWDVQRGRRRELERMQPGRATVVLGNLSRQYDSVNAAGPNFGNIKPMRRMRIRETFNGVTYPVFDGFVDRWQLDYPDKGKDAVAVVTATDGFKMFARADLGASVYDDQVLDDLPSVYLRLNERLNTAADATLTAHNMGTVGSAANATYIGPPLKLGQEGLIVKDPDGASIFTNQDTLGLSVVIKMGATVPESGFDLFDNLPFVLECWSLPIDDPIGTVLDDRLLMGDTGADGWQFFYQESTDKYVFAVANDTPTTLSVTASGTSSRNARHHTVLKFVAGETLKLWVDGVLTSGSTLSGTFVNRQNDDVHICHADTEPSNNNWVGNISNVAIYTGANATAVDQAWVDRHYSAGTAPWNGDLPGARIGRVADEASWPATLRELDAGITTFQSAAVKGQTGLEHIQKASESEYASLVFMSRAGNLRFVGRTAVFARESLFTFGDSGAEIGYTAFVPDDGDEVIRNRAIISLLDGAARTTTDSASVTAFGPFDYVLEGLLHNSDAVSQSYADIVVSEYKNPRRRITSLSVGPPIAGQEGTVYPAMLGPEIGDVITVRSRPVGGGAMFEQVCAIEGIRAAGAPGGVRMTTFTLSPEYVDQTF